MCAAQLGDGVIAITNQDALIERACLLNGLTTLCFCRCATWQLGELQVCVAQELVQKNLTQTFCRAAVARKESPGYFLRQLEAKYGSSQVGEKGCQLLSVSR